MNTCSLLGTVSRGPHVTFQAETGQQVVRLTVCVEEPRTTGDVWKTYIGVLGAVPSKPRP